MLKPQLHLSNSTKVPFLLHKPFIHGNFNASLPISMHSFCRKNKHIVRVGFNPNNIKAQAVASSTEKSVSVKAIVTVKPTVGGFLTNLGIDRGLDDVQDLLGKTLLLELVQAELDPMNFFLSFSFFFAMNFFVFFLYLFYKFYILCVKTRVKWVPIPCPHCKNICCKQKDIYYF